MKEYRGVVELGDYRASPNNGNTLYVYSYIQIGDSVIKKIGVCSGVNGKLTLAAEAGIRDVTLFVVKDYVVGITVNGKTYATDFKGKGFVLGILIAMSLFFIPFMGVGFLFAGVTYFTYWRSYLFTRAAKSLPNVILI